MKSLTSQGLELLRNGRHPTDVQGFDRVLTHKEIRELYESGRKG